MRVCFVVERFLGHVSYFNRLQEFVDNREELDPEYIYMGILGFPLRAFSDSSIPVLKAFDLDLHSVRWQITYSYSAQRQLKKALSANNFDSVYFHTQNVALLSGGIANQYPVVISTDATNHLLSEMGWDGRLPFTKLTWKPGIILERRIMKRAKRIIAWSNWVRDSLVHQYGINEEKIEVIRPFVPIPKSQIKRRTNNRPKLLFVGRDFQRKGGESLLRCFRQHFRDVSDLHIVTTSKVPEEMNVHVHHNISGQDLESLYRTSDVFAFPTWKDCSPQVVLEAMSFGLPVITTDVGALPEMVQHGYNGFVVHPDNSNELERGIRTMIEDSSLRREMGTNGRKLVNREYDLKSNAGKICSVLREVVG